ncbi:uncharacterized protein LOC106139137 isoform X2 [Amyelois transitella]|uniref:uncharacterized protein LOC106139137 isoform X2 n=1 Tax=Amyelois transitella TaxID=680683 RepID=UPI0029903B00|nr:uncharacterized protein LOC106139137 isoform X2 [Amyelois transitella]
MGGAVSSGRDNDELIDNLMGSNYIRTRAVEDVFRALDRAEYMTRDARDQAYKDVAWRSGSLHMSAPCIYSEVMENLELKPGLSFLNVGSGTGYLSTLVGLMLGSQGISHGIEVRQSVFEYANKRLRQFLENSPTLDEFDFCEPKFYHGNALCLAPLATAYDRVYCGAGCPSEYENYFKQLIKVGGILVMPLDDNLVQVKRLSESEWSSRTVLNVSFATLTIPSKEESANLLRLDEQTPVRLQVMARAAIRSAMRGGLRRRHPELRPPPPRAPPAKRSCPRRICIPVDDDSDIEGLGVLHDLYRDTGASEMNALLSFMLSMGHNRVAGALRYDTNASDDDDDDDDAPPAAGRRGDDGDDGNDGAGSPFPFHGPEAPDSQSDDESSPGFLDDRARRVGLITLDFDGQNSELGVPLLPVEPDSVIVRGDWPDTDSSDEEIYLGKTCEATPGTSKWSMEWEENGLVTPSSGDEELKVDSGVGDSPDTDKTDATPSDATPTDSTPSDTSPSEAQPSDSLSDDVDLDVRGGPAGRRSKRRAPDGGDARRVRLSILMKRGVKELPLPYALKKYVNLQRCFEF